MASMMMPPSNVNISVGFSDGKLVLPAVMKVKRGEQVAWGVTSERILEWTVYFHHGTPFSVSEKKLVTDSGAIVLGKAEQIGEYKYGIRLNDPHTRELVADDPYLIVT
jgi:hypothetical protein